MQCLKMKMRIILLYVIIVSATAAVVNQGVPTLRCKGNGSVFYGIDETWKGKICETCTCKKIENTAVIACYSTNACLTKSPLCIGQNRMVNVSSIDPCCPVCRSFDQICGNCTLTNSNVSLHVCGTNGITYNSTCLLNWNACAYKRDIKVEHLGDCHAVLSHSLSPTLTGADTNIEQATGARNSKKVRAGVIVGIVMVAVIILGFAGIFIWLIMLDRRNTRCRYYISSHYSTSGIAAGKPNQKTTLYPLGPSNQSLCPDSDSAIEQVAANSSVVSFHEECEENKEGSTDKSTETITIVKNEKEADKLPSDGKNSKEQDLINLEEKPDEARGTGQP